MKSVESTWNKQIRNGNRVQGVFSLVEIITLGFFLAIALQNFVKARKSSSKISCIAKFKQTDPAKEQWAMGNTNDAGVTVAIPDLFDSILYLKSTSICPSRGTFGLNPA